MKMATLVTSLKLQLLILLEIWSPEKLFSVSLVVLEKV